MAEKFMEHSYIEDHNIADRYLLGKLSTEERTLFEEHFVDCTWCLDRLETIDGFRSGLRTVAAEGKLWSRAYVLPGFLARIAQLSWAHQAALLTGVILMIALPVALIILEWRSARRELAQARQTISEGERKYEDSVQATRELLIEMQARERQASEQRDQLVAQLKREREDRMMSKTTSPQAVVPVFAISSVRSAAPDPSHPVNRIVFSSSSKSIVLLLELEPDPDLHSYRAALSTADGRSVWRKSKLSPISRDALALSFNSSLFKPENYLLTLEGLTGENRYVPIAQYTFRVIIQ